MLIQSDGNTISLLPALPLEWKDGNVSGIRARGGYEIAMKWNDSKVTELTISSVKKGKVTICVNGITKTVKTKANKTIRVI